VSDLKASIRIAILDSFTGPLKALGKALGDAQGKLRGIKAPPEAAASVEKTTKALDQLGQHARPALDQTARALRETGSAASALGGANRALGATGAAADDLSERMRAFEKVAELQGAVGGARRLERELRVAMRASGGDADAARKHMEAFGRLDALRRQLEEARRFERGLRSAAAGARTSLKSVEGETGHVGASFAALSRKAIAELGRADQAVLSSGAHLRAFEKLAELRRAEEGFRRVQRAAQGLGGPIGDAASKTAKLRDNLRTLADSTIALTGLKSAMQGIVSVANAPISRFVNFDEALGELQSKMPRGTAKDDAGLQSLATQAKDVGAKTKFTPQDILLAQAELAATGLPVADVAAVTPVTANLATAAGKPGAPMLPDEAAGVLTSAMAQFGMAADEASTLADQFVAGADASRSSVAELSAQLKYAGDVAQRFGMRSDKAITMLTLLSDQGQDKTTAGTNFREMMSKFAAPTKEAREALASVGVGGKTLERMRHSAATGDVESVLTELQKKLSKVEPEKRLLVLQRAFGDTGGASASALMKRAVVGSDGKTDIQRRFEEVSQTGLTAEKAAIKESTAKGQIDQAEGAWEAMLTNLGSKFAPEIEYATKAVSGFADWLSKFIDANPNTSKAVAIGGSALAGGAALWGAVKGAGAIAKTLGGGAIGSIGSMLGFGGSAAAAGTAAEGAALASAAAEVATASAAATEAVGAMGAAGAASGAGAAAAAGGAGVLGPLALAALPIAGGVMAHRTGADEAALDYVWNGGPGKAIAERLKGAGLHEGASDVIGTHVGRVASLALAPAATLPAIGSGLSRAWDWAFGGGAQQPAGRPAKPATHDALASRVPAALARTEPTGAALLAAPVQPAAPVVNVAPSPVQVAAAPVQHATGVAPSVRVDTRTLEDLAKQQLEAIRSQTKELQKAQREAREAQRRRGGGPQAGGVLGTF